MSSLRTTSRRGISVLLCAALAVGWVMAHDAKGDEVVSVPKKVGKVARFPTDIAKKYGIKNFKTIVPGQTPVGELIVDNARDAVYQIWTFISDAPSPMAGKTIVAERDLETMTLRRSLVIPHPIERANSYGVEFVHTLDRRNHRLFLEFGESSLERPGSFGLVVLDLKSFTFKTKDYPPLLVRSLGDQSQTTYGLEYDEEANQLIMLLAGIDNLPFTGNVANAISVLGWKEADLIADGPLPGPPSMLGPRYVRNCRRDPIAGPSSPLLSPIMIAKGPDLDQVVPNPPTKNWVVFPCYSTPYSVNNVLIRISREGLFDPSAREEKAIPAPTAIGHWAMDTKRGRMFLLNATQEVDAWVYEVASNAFIGVIEMTPKGDTHAASVGLGVDEASGRLYGYGGGFGLMISEAAQDPVPQADTYDAGAPNLAGSAVIGVDSKRDRIFLVRGAGGPDYLPDHYEIWKVPPPLPPQEAEDPDLLTAQVKEAEGKTTSEYGGVATAYGARILLASGLAGIPPSNGNDYVGGVYRDLNAKCGFRSREIELGVVPSTQLSESILDAHAESVHMDDNTTKDFGQPSRCDVYYQYAGPVPQIYPQALRDLFFTSLFGRIDGVRQQAPLEQQLAALGVDDALASLTGIDMSKKTSEHFNDATVPRTKWTYEPAYCTAAHYPKDKPGQNSSYLTGETFVDCRTPNDVKAHAEGHATGVLGEAGEGIALRVGRATSFTRVYLDKEEGLVSEATARAENVQIGEITIGFIENKARAAAHGRTGTAKTAEYRPRIGLVRGGGITGCEFRCDIDELLPQLNNALAGRAEVRRTKPDARLQLGSKGGYESGIIKSDKQQASDNALTGDDSREVSALEVIVYNDNAQIGRARQLVQLAGVRATSNYAIKLLNEGTPCGTECEPGLPPLGPPAPDGGTTVVTIEKVLPGKTIVKRVPVLGVPGGYRLLFADPRRAGAMATVWLLLLSPAIAYLRRRRLGSI